MTLITASSGQQQVCNDCIYYEQSRYYWNLNKFMHSFGWLVSKQRSQLWVSWCRWCCWQNCLLLLLSLTLYCPRNIFQSFRTDKLLSIRGKDIRYYTLNCLLVLLVLDAYTIEMILRKRCVGGKIGMGWWLQTRYWLSCCHGGTLLFQYSAPPHVHRSQMALM